MYQRRQYVCTIQIASYTQTIQRFLELPSSVSKPAKPDSFKESIQRLIKVARQTPNKIFTMTELCGTFGFQKRRLYDAINVFEIIGLCKKESVESIAWLGVDNIPKTLEKLKSDHGVIQNAVPLNEIYFQSESISISRLTLAFLLCILSISTKSFDIKRVCYILSQNNNRYKTTLCKLYQICHILESAGLLEKTQLPGEMILTINEDEDGDNSLSIESLLNRHIDQTSYITKQISQPFLLPSPVEILRAA